MANQNRYRRWKGARGLAASLAVALSVAVVAPGIAAAAAEKIDLDDRGRLGAPTLRELKGRAVQEAEAFLYYPVSQFDALRSSMGTMEFTARRVEATGSSYYPLAEFIESDGRQALAVYLLWKDVSGPEPRGSVLYVTNENAGLASPWGEWIPLGRSVAAGETIALTITWGVEPEQNRISVDGTEVPAYLDGIPESARRKTASRNGDFLRAIAKAKWLRVPNLQAALSMTDALPFSMDTEVNGVVFHDQILVPGGAGVAVASLAHDAARVAGFSGKLVAGNTMTVTMDGSPGATGTFDIVHYPDLDRKIALDWRGWGVYLEDKVFYEKGEINLRDVEGYRVYVGTEPFDLLAPGFEPVENLDVEVQSYLLENLEIDTPYYAAVLAEMRDGTLRTVVAPIANRPLAETAPGVYSGTWTAGYQDRLPRAVVVGRLTQGTQSASLVGTNFFAVDPALTIAVVTEPSVLKADEKSKAKVTVTVTDANNNPVSGHELKFLLATTSQYTGVVGGGAFTEQVGGTMKESAFGKTDLFGRLTATYVAGFAAKTAVIVVRDMASNDTAAGYVKTYITATAQLELLPVRDTAAMDIGYTITVTSSDEWLTADGKSQARITAKVALNGQPVEGHKVGFNVSSGAGSIRTVKDTTDRNGEARAVYTAGKKIGIVLITATDTTAGISGSVSIELRSDAPAKIAIKIDPEKLPADGRSRADVQVLVTDINDNPNDNVEVEYAITQGGGRLQDEKGLTDRRGETENTYTAGRSPGLVSIDITVRSTEPTAEEIGKARDLAVAVTDYKFF